MKILITIISIIFIAGIAHNTIAAETSFQHILDKQSSKKRNFGSVSTSKTVKETADFGWYIKSYSCVADTHGNHGTSTSCSGRDLIVQKNASGRSFVTQASCTGKAKIKGGTGNLGQTARFRCIFKGIKTNVIP